MEDKGTKRRSVKFSLNDTPEHLVCLEVLCEQLRTSCMNGLSSRYARELLRIDGPNKYTRPKCSLKNVSPLMKRFTKNKIDWSKKDWDRVFNSRIDQDYIVTRDRRKFVVRGRDLVRGDVVLLQTRQTVPADMRVVSYEGRLVVDNRVITGSSSEVKSNIPSTEDSLLSENMIFANTEIKSGICVGIVLQTGDRTVFGDLTKFAQKVRYTSRDHSSSVSSQSNPSISSSVNSDINVSVAGSLDSHASSLELDC